MIRQLIVASLVCLVFSEIAEQNLNSGWIFRQASPKVWHPWYKADVPSTVHLDLLDAKLIPDPYLGLNQLLLYQLEDKDWEYQMTFKVNQTVLNKNVKRLIFEGLDTHADVYLNDKLILQANNMHRTWVIDLGEQLKPQNTLRILFHSAALHDLAAEKANPTFNLPQNFSYSRKAQYQYGWDWGPRLVTCGIWKDVTIQAFDQGKIESFYGRTISIASDQAQLQFEVELELLDIGQYFLDVQMMGVNEQIASEIIMHQGLQSKSSYKIQYKVQNPMLWWPNGHGNQTLYNFQLVLRDNHFDVVDTKVVRMGIRTIEWVQNEDPDGGKSLFCKVNGEPIYIKGGNYIPPDMFMPRAQKNQSVYHQTINDAVSAKYNVMRLWGGGQFENDIFYELCDEKGLLIWHDLMFACAWYQGDEAFLANVAQEVTDNVKRIRSHASIAMWNGNNEVAIGWKEWGWKNGRSVAQIAEFQGWYDDLFLKTIPDVLSEVDPDTFYWPTSPSSSYGNTGAVEFKQGDLHFWGVWGSNNDIEDYSVYIGRFNSEYGMQAAPDYSSIMKFTNEQDRDIDSLTMQVHERHPQGWPSLKYYATKYFQQANSFQNQMYLTQVLQYISLEVAITSLRAAKPYNMGSIYWQINDVWPVVSWASIDFYGCWKAGHYAARRFHSDPILTLKLNKATAMYDLTVVSDIDVNGTIHVQCMSNRDGALLQENVYENVIVSKLRSQLVSSIKFDQKIFTDKQIFVYFWFQQTQGTTVTILYESTFHFVRPIDQELTIPTISQTKAANQLTLKSLNLVRNVYLGSDFECFSLSDNYFDLVPGFPKVITFNGISQVQLASYNITSLWDTYQK